VARFLGEIGPIRKERNSKEMGRKRSLLLGGKTKSAVTGELAREKVPLFSQNGMNVWELLERDFLLQIRSKKRNCKPREATNGGGSTERQWVPPGGKWVQQKEKTRTEEKKEGKVLWERERGGEREGKSNWALGET